MIDDSLSGASLSSHPFFMQGGGEAGALMRQINWSATPLGNPETWPLILKYSVRLMLDANIPMYIAWGEELLMLYNSAYLPTLGTSRHPIAMGASVRDPRLQIWAHVKDFYAQVRGGESVSRQDFKVVLDKSGYQEECYFDFSYTPIFDEQGKVLGVQAIFIETTGKVKAIERLELSNQRFHNLVMQAPIAIAVFKGRELFIELANDAYLPLIDKTREELVGYSFFDIAPGTRDVLEEVMKKNYHLAKPFYADEFPLELERNGKLETVYFNVVAQPLTDESGEVNRHMVVLNDVTAQVLARIKVQESETRFRTLVEAAPISIALFTGENLIIEMPNQAFIDLVGMGDSVIGKPFSDVIVHVINEGARLVDIVKNVMKTGKAYQVSDLQIDFITNGKHESKYYNFSYTPLFRDDGSVYAILSISLDVTEQIAARKMVEDLVAQRTAELAGANDALIRTNQELSRSNANLEEFTRAASHDLKEPIRKIKIFAGMLRGLTGAEVSSQQQLYFDRLERATDRMMTLITDLLNYAQAGHSPEICDIVDVNDIIIQVLNDLDLQIEQSNAVIQVDTLCKVKGHPRQLQQAFHNLISNALKYRQPNLRPQISIKCMQVRGDTTGLMLSAADATKHFYRINVRDNGIGFDQEDAEKIFNVFTRLHGSEMVRGSGVGLTIARRVIENHGGYIFASGKKNEGAVLTVFLPVPDESSDT